MAILSGKNGTLYIGSNEITPLSDWKLTLLGNHRDYIANDTGGWKKRAAGAKDSRGSFRVKAAEGGNAPVAEGDSVTLKLHVDGTGANYYQLDALVGQIDVETNISDGKEVALRIEFSGNGAVTPYGVLATGG